MRKISAWIVTLSMCLYLFSFVVFASSKQELQVVYNDKGKALENVVFSVYCLGNVTNGKINPNERFSSYKVSFDISDSEKLKKLADTLSAYILKDRLAADYTDTTDKNGTADFDRRAFSEGAYLITAKKHYDGNAYYTCEPVIVTLPYGGSSVLKINPKHEKVPEDATLSYKVLKVWVGDNKDLRPKEIAVELLRDGEVYGTVILNAENNWKYRWSGLSPQYSWNVAEKNVPDNYTVSLSMSQNTFLLTNTGNPSQEATTSPDGTTAPADSTSPAETTTPEEEKEELPDTGVLRWPVPYLAMSGVLIFAIGYVRYRKSEAEDE